LNTYFYRDNSGKEIGPFDLDTLAKLRLAGMLNDNTLVRAENTTEWKSLREFLPSLAAAPQTTQSSKKSANWTWAGLFIAVVIILAASHFNNSSQKPDQTLSSDAKTIEQLKIDSERDYQKARAEAGALRNQPSTKVSDIEAENACINNLRQIDAAINEWALENGKSNGALPTMADIKGYIKLTATGEVPSCPAGGIYTLHPVGSNPQVSCSIPGHALP
jgi:hypothetical protein